MTSNSTSDLHENAQALAEGLPRLIAVAEALSAGIHTGLHGRRHAGSGESFWQYRHAETFEARRIDWRRSARSDDHFVQDKEWQVAQKIWLYVDPSASMEFASDAVSKKQRAQELALALGLLLLRGGERVGVWGGEQMRMGKAAFDALAHDVCVASASGDGLVASKAPGMVVWISDFLGEQAHLEQKIARVAAMSSRAVLLQILDPLEQDFPFSGRYIFELPGGNFRFETRDAAGICDAYLMRLQERQDILANASRRHGWLFQTHCTSNTARAGLLRLWHGIGGHV